MLVCSDVDMSGQHACLGAESASGDLLRRDEEAAKREGRGIADTLLLRTDLEIDLFRRP